MLKWNVIQFYSSKFVMLFAIFYAVPFIFISPIAGKLLRAGAVSYVEVMLACVFPFPLIAYWVIHHLFLPVNCKNKVGSAAEQPEQMVSESNGSNLISEEAQVLLGAYQGAYKEKYSYWEGVIEIRKLIFCSFYLIQNNMFRLVFCTITSVLILVHHIFSYPFAHVNSNRAEALSLSLLCVACVTNSIKSVFAHLGEIVEPNTPTEQLLIFLNRIDNIFVFILLSYIVISSVHDNLKKHWRKKHE